MVRVAAMKLSTGDQFYKETIKRKLGYVDLK